MSDESICKYDTSVYGCATACHGPGSLGFVAPPDLNTRLDAMVREQFVPAGKNSGIATLRKIALDLLAKLAATEDQVESLKIESEGCLKGADKWSKDTFMLMKERNEALSRLDAAEATSEGRLKALNEKAEELRKEWIRAERAEAQVKALTTERDGLLKAKLWRDHWPSGDLLGLAREERKTKKALTDHMLASYYSRQDSEKGRAIAEAHTKALARLNAALFVAVHEELENFDRAALKLDESQPNNRA